MEEHVKIRGNAGEQWFSELMSRHKTHCEFVGLYYDFLVENLHKVEVKSCAVSVKNGCIKRDYKVGRWDFTDESVRNTLYQENCWIAFIIQHQGQFILYGITKAQKLWKDSEDCLKHRYISIHNAHRNKNNLMDIGGFIMQVKGTDCIRSS